MLQAGSKCRQGHSAALVKRDSAHRGRNSPLIRRFARVVERWWRNFPPWWSVDRTSWWKDFPRLAPLCTCRITMVEEFPPVAVASTSLQDWPNQILCSPGLYGGRISPRSEAVTTIVEENPPADRTRLMWKDFPCQVSAAWHLSRFLEAMAARAASVVRWRSFSNEGQIFRS